MDSRLLERQFWLELRAKIDMPDEIGTSKCWLWCGQAMKELNAKFSEHTFFIYSAFKHKNTEKWNAYNIWQHLWLENRDGGKRFIADGTAGQIDSTYPFGFYGFKEEASKSLKTMYNCRTSQDALIALMSGRNAEYRATTKDRLLLTV